MDEGTAWQRSLPVSYSLIIDWLKCQDNFSFTFSTIMGITTRGPVKKPGFFQKPGFYGYSAHPILNFRLFDGNLNNKFRSLARFGNTI